MLKRIKRTTMVLLSSLLFIAALAIGVQAAETENPLDLDLSSISGISMMDEIEPASVTLPGLYNGTYQKWIDRINIPSYHRTVYNYLVEGSDNDNVNDFLINPNTGDFIRDIELEYTDDNGKTQKGYARALQITTLSVRSSNLDTIVDDFYETFEQFFVEEQAVFEAFMMDNPKVFWLNSALYLAVPSVEAEQLNNGFVRLSGTVYGILTLKDQKGNTVFDVRHAKYNENSIRVTLAEINTIIDNVVKEVKHEDTAAKIRHFNQYLVSKNELNTITGDEQVLDLFTNHPEVYSCVSALRGITGTYAPVYTSYAMAFQTLCDHAGIPTTLVMSDLNGGAYLWNLVQVDGKWYGVDCGANDYPGSDSEAVLLAGKNTVIDTDGYTFGQGYNSNGKSDPSVGSGIAFSNCPPISEYGYTYAVKELNLSVSDNNYMYGYMDPPVITAEPVLADGQSGTPTYAWFIINEQGHLTQFGGTGNTTEFPNVTKPGTHTIICQATLNGTTKREKIQVEVTIFQDVKNTDWFFNSVDWAIKNNITYGLNSSAFGSVSPCTRGQIVTFIWRAAGSPEPVNTVNTFKDVASNAYYYNAVLWAVENGITSGYSPEQFAPDASCTRAEMVTFLWRVGGKKVVEDKVHPYQDVKADGFYYDAMLWAVEEGIAAGYTPTKFAPFMTVTRAETVTFLYRANGNPIETDKNDGPSKMLDNKVKADEAGALYNIPSIYVESGLMQEVLIYENHLLVWGYGVNENGESAVTIAILNMATGEPLQKKAFTGIELADVSVCGEKIALTDGATGNVLFLDGGLQTLSSIKGNGEYGSVFVNEAATTIYTFNYNKGITKKDVATGEETALLGNVTGLLASERCGFSVSFTYTDTSSQMSKVAVLDFNTGEILFVPFENATTNLQYSNEVWFSGSADNANEYLLGTKDSLLTAKTTDTLRMILSPERLLEEKQSKNGMEALTLYNLDGTFVSKCVIKETGMSFFSTPVWSEKDQGYYFILISEDGKDKLMYWDTNVQTEGSDLTLEVVSEEDYIGTEVSEEFYHKANALSEQYGIKVKIAEFCMTSSSNYTVEQMLDEEVIAFGLEVLEEVLASYPEGFFEQLKYGDQRVIEIHLSGDLLHYEEEEDYYSVVGGFANSVGIKNHAVVDITADEQSLKKTFYHEIMHLIDYRLMFDAKIREDAVYSEETWLAFNPEGFKYVEEYDKLPDGYYNDGYGKYFIDNYARTNSKEDRARIMEYAMIGDSSKFPENSALFDKLSYLCECIRDTFDTTGWPEVTVWENTIQ